MSLNKKSREELKEVIEDYTWIKVKRYEEEDSRNPNVDWKMAYKELLQHHKKETEFLINKCRDFAQELLDDGI